MNIVLAVNIGGSITRVALITDQGLLIGQLQYPTQCDDYVATLQDIRTMFRLQWEPDYKLMAVGVCVACPLDADGNIGDTANMPDWAGRKFLTDMTTMFGVEVIALNDAQAEGLGEEADLFVGLGTGIGVSIFGKPTEGGHFTIDSSSTAQCGCKGFGHFEALVGGANLPRRFGFPHGTKLTDEQWATVTDEQWEGWLDDLAVGLVNLSLFAPGAPIVLGGGNAARLLSQAGKNLLPLLQQKVNQRKTTIKPPTLVLARHGEDSALYGLARAAWRLVSAF